MVLHANQLKAIMPNVEKNLQANKHLKGVTLDKIVELLNKYAEEFSISTGLQWAHYLAQIAHESGEFRYTEEIASGEHYEGRKDLGNTHKGDGVKYKGRGLIQLTGRANYAKYKVYCGYDVVSNPDLLAMPVGAVRSSMWFWKTHNLNYFANIDAVISVTKIINGGTNGLSQRMAYLRKAKHALNV